MVPLIRPNASGLYLSLSVQDQMLFVYFRLMILLLLLLLLLLAAAAAVVVVVDGFCFGY